MPKTNLKQENQLLNVFIFAYKFLIEIDEPDIKTTELSRDAIWHDQISFDGTGYVELDKKLISHDWDKRLEITIDFSTWSREALIIWQGSRQHEDPNYMSLGSKNECGKMFYQKHKKYFAAAYLFIRNRLESEKCTNAAPNVGTSNNNLQ